MFIHKFLKLLVEVGKYDCGIIATSHYLFKCNSEISCELQLQKSLLIDKFIKLLVEVGKYHCDIIAASYYLFKIIVSFAKIFILRAEPFYRHENSYENLETKKVKTRNLKLFSQFRVHLIGKIKLKL